MSLFQSIRYHEHYKSDSPTGSLYHSIFIYTCLALYLNISPHALPLPPCVRYASKSSNKTVVRWLGDEPAFCTAKPGGARSTTIQVKTIVSPLGHHENP